MPKRGQHDHSPGDRRRPYSDEEGPRARLEQGGVYLDLADLSRGEFTAVGDQQASAGHRYIAKRDTDHELWSRLLGRERLPDDEPVRSP